MTDRQITLRPAQLRQIAGYERTFRDFLMDIPFRKEDFLCPEAYSYTLEDLGRAVRALRASDPTV